MDSISVRPSVLTERRHIRDTYCPQDYQNGDQVPSDQQPRPSVIQKYIQYRDNSNTEIVNSEAPIKHQEEFKLISSKVSSFLFLLCLLGRV